MSKEAENKAIGGRWFTAWLKSLAQRGRRQRQTALATPSNPWRVK
jgi:hypothetical protein